MSSRPGPAPRPDPWSDPRLRVPSAQEWAAMSETAKAGVEGRIFAVFSEHREAMSEGTPHSRAKINAYKDLGDHFARAGRRVFLATELAVLYPDEPAIVPDLLAVMDVEDAERERNSWRVADEGRGIDLVLEFRNEGKKHKDLVENVREYAHLGIPEYLSFDCKSKLLRGWRLAGANARTYTRIVPQGGVFPSRVLGLDLGVADGRLRFFHNQAVIPSSEELVGRLQKMADAYQEKLEEAKERNERVRAGMRALLLQQIEARGLAITEAQREEVLACEDSERLVRWLAGVGAAASVEALLSE